MTIDIQKFCAREEGRYAITKPWVYAAWQYCTDGRVCIRLPSYEKDTKQPGDSEIKFPPAHKLFDAHDSPMPYAWPEGHKELFKAEACYCSGGEDKCEYCDKKIKLGHEHSCPDDIHCEEVPCGECDGVGSIKSFFPVQFPETEIWNPHTETRQIIQGAWIRSDYAVLIATLPKVFYGFHPRNNDMLLFRFDGGEGIVMRHEAPSAEMLEEMKRVL